MEKRINSRLIKIPSLSNIGYLLYLLIVTIVIAEIILRIYNPFPFRLKGNKIILPVNKKTIISNNAIPGLDGEIKHTKNSLGFRGPELPENYKDYLSIITVGGSTTECYYLSDEKTWSSLLGKKLKTKFEKIWLNNAGLDGHSTFGHQILLKDFIVDLNPKVIIFLVGKNDVGRDDLNTYDKKMISPSRSLREFVENHSELANIVINFIRASRAAKERLGHNYIDITKEGHSAINDSEMKEMLNKQQELVRNYKSRLSALIETCRKNHIVPILLTQPLLVGAGLDATTGVNLETIGVKENGKTSWQKLELYNEVTRSVGKETDTHVVDLGRVFPKNSLYYYDYVHYNNAGAEKVAEMLFDDLSGYLAKQFPNLLTE